MRFLNKHAAREKQLRRLDRELWRLRRVDHTTSTLPLEHPRHCGWTKTYVLADGIDRRPDAAIFHAMLAAVNRTAYSAEFTFIHPRTRQPIVLQPRVLHLREMEAYGWPALHRRFFELGTWLNENPPTIFPPRHARSIGYKLVHTGWLRENIQPRLVTHQRVESSEVESRSAEIRSFMVNTRGWEKLNRLYGRSDRWRCKTRAESQSGWSLAEQLNETTPD